MTFTFDIQGHVNIELTDPINKGPGNIRILLWYLELPKLMHLELSKKDSK